MTSNINESWEFLVDQALDKGASPSEIPTGDLTATTGDDDETFFSRYKG